MVAKLILFGVLLALWIEVFFFLPPSLPLWSLNPFSSHLVERYFEKGQMYIQEQLIELGLMLREGYYFIVIVGVVVQVILNQTKPNQNQNQKTKTVDVALHEYLISTNSDNMFFCFRWLFLFFFVFFFLFFLPFLPSFLTKTIIPPKYNFSQQQACLSI